MAALPDEERNRYLCGSLDAITARTIVDEAGLRADIERTLARGYAVSREETYEGVVGVAAAYIGPNDRPLGSIAIAGPMQRIDEKLVDRYGALLVAAAAEIQSFVGGRFADQAGREDAA